MAAVSYLLELHCLQLPRICSHESVSNDVYIGKMHPVHVLHDNMLCHGVARRGRWMVVAAIYVV